MTENKKPWTRDEFEQQLRSREKYYHINHDFHILMNEGGLDKEAVQGWVANRFLLPNNYTNKRCSNYV